MPFRHEFKRHEDEIDYAEIEACYEKLKELDDYIGSSEFECSCLARGTRTNTSISR